MSARFYATVGGVLDAHASTFVRLAEAEKHETVRAWARTWKRLARHYRAEHRLACEVTEAHYAKRVEAADLAAQLTLQLDAARKLARHECAEHSVTFNALLERDQRIADCLALYERNGRMATITEQAAVVHDMARILRGEK